MPVNARDFMFDFNVLKLNADEVGQYIYLLLLCWEQIGIEKDPDMDVKDTLSLAIATLRPGWNLSDRVARLFYEKKGRIFQKRVELELERVFERHKANVEHGLIGAKVRYNKEFTLKQNGYSQAMARLKPGFLYFNLFLKEYLRSIFLIDFIILALLI